MDIFSNHMIHSNTSHSKVGYVLYYQNNATIAPTKRKFLGLAHKDPYVHLSNLIEVYGPFVLRNIFQVFVRLRLFPFSLMGEATRWLGKFPNDSITFLEELNDAFLEISFSTLKVFKIQT